MNTWILTGIAGCSGVLLRVWLDSIGGFSAPTVTLLINASGSLIAAVIATLATHGGLITAEHRLILVSGFCGGLTTFSALSLQSLGLITTGEWLRGLGYLLGSPLLGLSFAYVGMKLAS